MHQNYFPTKEDMLKSRVRTTGNVHNEYKEKNRQFWIVDTGGERNER